MKGTSASAGIGIGKAAIVEETELVIKKETISDAAAEKERFHAALNQAMEETDALAKDLATRVGEKEAEILNGHLMLLSDPMLTGEIENTIAGENACSEYAIENVCNMYADMFASMGDELMQQRATDMRDIKTRMQKILLGVSSVDIASLPAGSIIVAKDLTPSMTAGINPDNVCGIVTELGGKTSHSAILARALEIPAVVAVEGFLQNVKDGDTVVLDGSEGIVFVNPEETVTAEYETKRTAYLKEKKELDQYIDSAIGYLPLSLQREALAKMKEINNPKSLSLTDKARTISPIPWKTSLFKGGCLKIEGLSYQMYDKNDFKNYLGKYLRTQASWAFDDIGKTGLDQSGAVSVTLSANAIKQEIRKEPKGTRTICELEFPHQEGVDPRVYPHKMYVDILEDQTGKKAEIDLTILNKPAVRLPEAYWLSFNTDQIVSIVAEKIGERVDILDVVEQGNRQMHGIDHYVDLITSAGTIRIWSETAFLVNLGEAQGINYSRNYPDKRGGIHFNLSNNLWGTNFSMWNEGSLTYRFIVERLD